MNIKYDRPVFHWDEEKKEYTKPENRGASICEHKVVAIGGIGVVRCAICNKMIGSSCNGTSKKCSSGTTGNSAD